jgi:SET domain
MYKSYLKVEPTKNGKGTFTTVRIPADTPVMEITGTVLLDKDLPANADMNLYLQVGPNTYLGPSGEADDFINHSCDPNCKLHVVGNRAILWSLYIIPAGAELTFDYSTTSTDTLDTWKMNCKCGSYKCRKVISGYSTLDPALQNNYKSRDMLPMYITWPGLLQKR